MRAMRLALATAFCGLHFAAAAATNSLAPSFSAAGVVNAASGQTTLAPYSICSLYGTNLYLNGTASATGTGTVPSTLAGVTVLLGGTPAGIFYLSANQINLLIPNSLGPGQYEVTVVRDGIASQPAPVMIQAVAPGLFTTQAGSAAAFHADSTAVSASSPAVPGEVIVIYATGLGRTQPDPIDRSFALLAAEIVDWPDFQLLLDGVAIDPVLVEYVGLTPLDAGLYQVNVQLPANLSAANPQIQVGVAGFVSPSGVILITGPAGTTSP